MADTRRTQNGSPSAFESYRSRVHPMLKRLRVSYESVNEKAASRVTRNGGGGEPPEKHDIAYRSDPIPGNCDMNSALDKISGGVGHEDVRAGPAVCVDDRIMDCSEQPSARHDDGEPANLRHLTVCHQLLPRMNRHQSDGRRGLTCHDFCWPSGWAVISRPPCPC